MNTLLINNTIIPTNEKDIEKLSVKEIEQFTYILNVEFYIYQIIIMHYSKITRKHINRNWIKYYSTLYSVREKYSICRANYSVKDCSDIHMMDIKMQKYVADKCSEYDCNCPYIYRIYRIQCNQTDDTYMSCRICGKKVFEKDIIKKEELRQENIKYGLYLASELTSTTNIINELPVDISKNIIQYI